ncbi:alpha/beta hydrolase family protein [Amycolatopsis minnesotensis]|uniref:AB hydrolase-1 domain-containing protein n=1 Tax=Amycolatopsis minnesotensis TaxID=337894 RepID=A0ABP5D5M9_9PSEU
MTGPDLVGLGTHAVWAKVEGSQTNAPPVVFEGPLGGPVELWSYLQRELARDTLTVSYQRAGTAPSTRAPGPRTAPKLAEDLGELLTALGIDRPVVLVAHTFGAMAAHSFAVRWPDRVHGLVLVDPMHPGELMRSAAQRKAMAQLEAALVRSGVKTLLRRGRGAAAASFDWLPAAERESLSRCLDHPRTWFAALSELVAWKNSAGRFAGGFPAEVPVVVLGSKPRLGRDKVAQALVGELTAASARPAFVMVPEESAMRLTADSPFGAATVDAARYLFAEVTA